MMPAWCNPQSSHTAPRLREYMTWQCPWHCGRVDCQPQASPSLLTHPMVTIALPDWGSVRVSLGLAAVAAWLSSAFLACFWARSASCLARRSARSSALLLPPAGFSPSLGPSAKAGGDVR